MSLPSCCEAEAGFWDALRLVNPTGSSLLCVQSDHSRDYLIPNPIAPISNCYQMWQTGLFPVPCKWSGLLYIQTTEGIREMKMLSNFPTAGQTFAPLAGSSSVKHVKVEEPAHSHSPAVHYAAGHTGDTASPKTPRDS